MSDADRTLSLPATGSAAPPFTLPDLDGHEISLSDLTATHHLMLFFMREFT